MKRLTHDIRIERWKFKGLVKCEVVSTYDNLTDTAILEVPQRSEKWQRRGFFFSGNPILKKGDRAKIQLGYDDTNRTWFEGYLTNIQAAETLVLQMQDSMFLLKTGEHTLSYKKAKLSDVMRDVLPKNLDYEVVADYDLGQLRITKMTAAQILEELRKSFFIRAFFRDKKLYIGLAQVPKLQKLHKIKYIISDSLEYRSKENTRIKLNGVLMMPDGKKIEITIGDTEGEVRTFHQYNMSEADFRKLLERELELLRYDGFRGSFRTFIEPFVNHGDIVELPNSLYNLDTGGSRYYVKKVTRAFDGKEYQDIELDRKAK